jgi:cbb3-type cytochrome oxidase maturation protein
MEMLVWLIPVSLGLGGLALLAFFWSMKTRQYDDLEGAGERILLGDYDEVPKANAGSSV